jgi:hypothetical protein
LHHSRGNPREPLVCELHMTIRYRYDVYAREVVMTRVGHLLRRKQREIEKITRILRGCFDPNQVQAPEPGRIKSIILIGPYARRSWYEDERTIDFSDYEFWIVVNHPLFKEECCWQRACEVIGKELENRCAVDLDFYSKSDIRIAKAERDTFILDRIEAGITLFRATRDAPLSPSERGEARS